MLMAQAVISASSIGLPRLGVSANALPVAITTARAITETAGLGIDMLDLPFAIYSPARDGVVMLIGETEDRRLRLEFAARGHELLTGRLNVTRLVPGPALQDRRTAIPAPWHAAPG